MNKTYNLQDFCAKAGESACLAMCYIRKALIDVADPLEANNTLFMDVATISALISAFYNEAGIEEDFYVNNPVELMKGVAGKNYTVSKKDILHLSDLSDVEWSAVRFDNGKNSHFVLCHFDKIFWNPMHISQCVISGKPTTARIIKEL
jgi:hypothetical protein